MNVQVQPFVDLTDSWGCEGVATPRVALVDDWTILVGAEVEIRRNGLVVREGSVELVTPDGMMLWISGDHYGTRRLFDKTEGYQAWAAQHNKDALFYEIGRIDKFCLPSG